MKQHIFGFSEKYKEKGNLQISPIILGKLTIKSQIFILNKKAQETGYFLHFSPF